MKHMNFIAPYSHYFYKAMHLIGTPNEQSVFLCLWGRAMAGCKNKQTLSVKASVSQIAKSVRCSWGTVNNVLNSLEKKKFITSYDDSTYTIDAKRFMAINVTFEGLSKKNDVEKFCLAVDNGDDQVLAEFGCNWNDQSNVIDFPKGGLLNFEEVNNDNGSESSSIFNSCDNDLLNFEEVLGIEGMEPIKFLTGLSSGSSIFNNSDWQGVVKNITEYISKHQFLEIALLNFEQQEHDLLNFEEVFGKKRLKLQVDELYKTEKLLNFEQFCLVLRFLMKNYEIFNRGLLNFEEQYINNIYKIYPNMLPNMFNKDNNFKETCIKHERSECFNIGGEQIKTLQNDCGSENDDDWEDEDNLPADHEKNSDDDYEPEPLTLDPHAFDKFNAKNELFRKRRRLQFIPPAEIEEYISNLPACLDRPDKIFINQLWEILKELAMGGYENESGEWVEVEQDPDGMQFPAERIMIDVLQPAYESTVEILERGVVEYKGEELPVETKEDFPPESVDLIVDWQTESDVSGRYYIVSILKFRNIYAPEVEEKKRTGLSDIRAAVREHRERDKDYMAQIIRMGEDDVENEKLTDIEIVAYNFIKDNFNFTPEGKILDPKTEYLNRNGLARFYLTFKGSTVSSQDFLGILFNNEPERGTGALILKPRVFSSQAIMEWNEKHAQKSAIIPLDE